MSAELPNRAELRAMSIVVPWAIRILGPYFNAAVDARGHNTDFTLKKKKKKKWGKNTENY